MALCTWQLGSRYQPIAIVLLLVLTLVLCCCGHKNLPIMLNIVPRNRNHTETVMILVCRFA